MVHKIPKFILICCLIIGSIQCVGLRPNPRFNEPGKDDGRANSESEKYLRDGRFTSSVTRRLMQEIQSYLGVPYRWGGSTRKGRDCSGFVRVVFQNAAGVKIPHSARAMFKQGKYIEEQELKYGDLVFFENIENYGVSHVGIFVGNQEFAHASTSRGVIISNLNEKYYRSRFVGARKISIK